MKELVTYDMRVVACKENFNYNQNESIPKSIPELCQVALGMAQFLKKHKLNKIQYSTNNEHVNRK